MSTQNEWQDVDEFLPNWNPIYTGSKKDKNIKYNEVNEQSYLDGYYLGMREINKDKRNYTVHKFQGGAIGNPAHCDSFKEGEEVECFGTGVLDNLLKEKVKPGQYVRIQYMGKVAKKDNEDEKYHFWKVFVNNSKAPLNVMNNTVVDNPMAGSTTPPVAGTESVPAGVPESVMPEGDDDLPF